MLIYPDDRVLVAIINNEENWRRVQDEQWYRLPVKHAPLDSPNFDWIAFYFPKIFKEDKGAIHFFCPDSGSRIAHPS